VKKYRILFLTFVVTTLIGTGAYQIYRANGFDNTANFITKFVGIKNTTSKAKPFNKQQYSVDDSASIWVVVNKIRPLKPKDYSPAELVVPDVKLRFNSDYSEMHISSVIANPLKQLFSDASKDGLSLMIASGYRSYSAQDLIYNISVNTIGQSEADLQNARAGFSEHQTGLAVDVEPGSRNCETLPCFADTPEGRWLADNVYKYGFILRYPLGKENITGYQYEPWHIRYVGNDLASQMHISHIQTLEEFFGLLSAPNYL